VTFAPKIDVSFKKSQYNPKNPTLRWVFFKRVFWVLLGGFFIANPEINSHTRSFEVPQYGYFLSSVMKMKTKLL
jgi:hypothetical protein